MERGRDQSAVKKIDCKGLRGDSVNYHVEKN